MKEHNSATIFVVNHAFYSSTKNQNSSSNFLFKSKEHNSRMGDNTGIKKYGSPILMEYQHMKCQDPSCMDPNMLEVLNM